MLFLLGGKGGFTASTMQLQYCVLYEPPFGGGAKCFMHEFHTSLLHQCIIFIFK